MSLIPIHVKAIHYLVGRKLEEIKRELVLETLHRHKTLEGAALALGISYRTLHNLRKKYSDDPRSRYGRFSR